MPQSSQQLRSDALKIWHAGLEAVRSEKLMHAAMHVEGQSLVICGLDEQELQIDLNGMQRIAVVGAGKAGAGMAAALVEILGPELMADKQLNGSVNVPADCVRELNRVHLHSARPAGVNEPTAEGVQGTEEILRIVGSLNPNDLCIALISGGGSALMPAPIERISLTDKLAVTRFLSAAGADIAELNTVRKQLSRIKGGGLARACRAGRLVSLIISDIPGDPLDLIASGPTVADSSTPQEALEVLRKFGATPREIPESVWNALSRKAATGTQPSAFTCHVNNIVIGNNAMAVDAAGMEAERLGYAHAMTCAAKPEGAVELIGRHLADMALLMRSTPGPNCLISGGEGTVKLISEAERGMGGRNQQTVLAALIRLAESESPGTVGNGIAILSGGTDGEDGPTDAAGAFIDSQIIAEANRRGLNAGDFLRRNDAYHFFQPLEALIKTGPTHTNVCDLRVVLVENGEAK